MLFCLARRTSFIIKTTFNCRASYLNYELPDNKPQAFCKKIDENFSTKAI